ncbi:hypothetical protein AB0I60_08225 [Actinosynnema sp. NPDC050436]|uniref:hypothetical protein n=1 Tax=Actinosynnema sp. NPDC050436 TaxID=3155659 RepID=UPI0033DB9F59
MQSDHTCDLCAGSGTMTWIQPVPAADGALVLTEVSHPCTCPRSTWRRFPAAERGTVVDPGGTGVAGNVADANRAHRTDWSRPGWA